MGEQFRIRLVRVAPLIAGLSRQVYSKSVIKPSSLLDLIVTSLVGLFTLTNFEIIFKCLI